MWRKLRKGTCFFGMRGIENMRNDHGIGAEIQRLLDRAAFRRQHFCQYIQAQSFENRNETIERIEIEAAMFDIEDG